MKELSYFVSSCITALILSSLAQITSASHSDHKLRLEKARGIAGEGATIAATIAVDPNQIILGSAAAYSVFASTGISTIPGDLATGQVVHGDIGVAPIAITAITGFGAVEDGTTGNSYVSGAIRGPPTTGTVALAILTSFNAAYGMPVTVPSNAGLATNYLDTVGTLRAGVYKWAGPIVIGVGTILTLDGKCGDVFIFQSAGAVTTGANSQIILNGGLTAASVYWASATSFTSGVGSITAGIVLTGTTAVIAGIHTGAVYAQTSVALHQATVIIPSIGSTTGTASTICAIAGSAVVVSSSGSVPTSCPAGQGFQTGTTVCAACSPGFYSSGKMTTCTACLTTPHSTCTNSGGRFVGCIQGFIMTTDDDDVTCEPVD